MRKSYSPSVSAGAAGYRKQNHAVGDLVAQADSARNHFANKMHFGVHFGSI
jgi:hypothetical protein